MVSIRKQTDSVQGTASDYRALNQEVKQAFIQAGVALKKIRDQRLYCFGEYDTFAEYCTAELDITESYASRWINGAFAAKAVVAQTSLDVPNRAVAYELHRVDKHLRAAVMLEAAEYAVSEGKQTVTSAHIRRADAELSGGIPADVKAVASRLGVSFDTERIMILKRWHSRATDDGHSKWDSVRDSGVLDPGDDGDPVIFASATVQEITALEKRWQASRIAISTQTQFVIGRLSAAPIIDGQPVPSLAGKRVKITIQGDSDD